MAVENEVHEKHHCILQVGKVEMLPSEVFEFWLDATVLGPSL